MGEAALQLLQNYNPRYENVGILGIAVLQLANHRLETTDLGLMIFVIISFYKQT